MARYVIPSVTISALYSAYRHYYPAADAESEYTIKSIDQAVTALNNNVGTEQALRFIQQYRNDVSFLPNMSAASLGLLAQRGSELCHFAPVKQCDSNTRDHFETILNKFDLGDDWHSALEWLNRIACPEDEDLACSEEWLSRRPSQVERLFRLLQLLFLKTEKSCNTSSISVDVVPFLFNIYTEFCDSNTNMSVLALKTLSNIASISAEYASAIFKSEWLPLLSDLIDHGKLLEERLISHKVCNNALCSLGVSSYRLGTDVYELHCSTLEPEVDIIMIHGLRGSVGYTWRQSDDADNIVTECWPKDWLPLDIPQPIRIIGLDYPSHLVQFTGSMESLQIRANRFKDQLAEAGIGRRPVVFICHSMGGLLAKRLLLDLPSLTASTVGVLFIATPHRGSPIAAWGYSVLHPTEDVRFLHEQSPLNRKLNEDFASISDAIPVIVSMVETKESDVIGTKRIIVPNQSAVFEKGAVYHIEEVHHNMCKPSQRSSPSYNVVVNFLKDCVQESKSHSKH